MAPGRLSFPLTIAIWGKCMLVVARVYWAALAAAALIAAAGLAHAVAGETGVLVEVKMGLNSLNKTDRAALWKRLDEYATVDALQEFCGKKLNLQRRTWAAVSPCVEVSSLRKVAAVFRAKKTEYMKAWETAHGEPEKKKLLCDSWQTKLTEYSKIIDSHIAEAKTMCDVCVFC
jgi:hypothetical protein